MKILVNILRKSNIGFRAILIILGSICALFLLNSMVCAQNDAILPDDNVFSGCQARSSIDTDNKWIQIAIATVIASSKDLDESVQNETRVLLRGDSGDNPIFELTSDDQTKIHLGEANKTHWEIKIQIHSGNGPGRTNSAQSFIVDPDDDNYNYYIKKATGLDENFVLDTTEQPLLYDTTNTKNGIAPGTTGVDEQRLFSVL